ncbi:anthranilate synthase family protein [Actinoplanes sp. NBRC 103695]|uniref:anthranilate synthase family protein n=1 Tax=Actinoplanes sp. NBRC 103695 TaxID=3032202 RepID=UPI0024A0CC9C|nr:anthranilate synthase family protein [Actinoplanes sp. NBRC 103695]GLZ02069.1 phenazine-specific anthranilate synthase component I [Actinoplanes sp. NBRC 103695]
MTGGPWASLEPPFVVLHREGRSGVEILRGQMLQADSLAGLPDAELFVLVPFRQIRERGFAHHDDGTPLSALLIDSRQIVPLDEAVRGLPRERVDAAPGSFDLDDDAYAELVRTVVSTEIGRGAGANFVLKRSFTTTVTGWSPRAALSFFGSMLRAERGAYWTFLAHTGTRTLVGATPERHIGVEAGQAVMNPISGTYRFPADGPTVRGVLDFLTDAKETDELEMVVDEELKMMARISEQGVRITGPRLRLMSRVAHTEYLIEGRTGLDAREVLRETMFAPTVTGSPLRNACSVITRHETSGRGYYSGVAALIDTDDAGRQRLDSAIIIRTADIDDAGRMQVSTGATLVRHSDPASEAAETVAKLDGLRAALFSERAAAGGASPVSAASAAEPAVLDRLRRRNERLAPFWLGAAVDPEAFLAGRRCLLLDADDDFTAMLAHQLCALGLRVTIRSHREQATLDAYDLVVLGPGPGDPRDPHSAAGTTLRRAARHLLTRQRPFVAVCLGHQILCDVLGLPLAPLPTAHQGTARTVPHLGAHRTVGFYNSFAAYAGSDLHRSALTPAPVVVNRDAGTGEVYGLHGSHFSSMQFHPESVLSRDGLPALRNALRLLFINDISRPAMSRRQALAGRPQCKETT